MKHYKKHIFLGPVQSLADSLQARAHVPVAFFVLVLQGVRAHSRAVQAMEGCLPFPNFEVSPFEAMHCSQPGFITS